VRRAVPHPYLPPPAARCTADLIALVITLGEGPNLLLSFTLTA
jgi:hypothetical protein